MAEARRAREQVDEDEQAACERHQESMKGVRQKLERARKYMSESGLERAIPEVWETIEHWANWVKMPDRWTAPTEFHSITGAGEFKDRWVAWIWNDHRYRMHFVEKHNYLPDDYNRLSQIDVGVGEEQVCSVNCSQGSESHEQWRYIGVEALTVGPWMAEFVRMAGHLRAATQASTRELFSEMDRERASRINLGE